MPEKDFIETLVPDRVNDTRPYYSHVTSAPAGHRLIIFAGQVGRRLDGSISSNFVEQVEDSYCNLRQCLDTAGVKVTDIMKLTYHIVNYDPSNRLHRGPTERFLQGHLPAATLLPVSALADPKFLFEVEAIAAIPEAPIRDTDVVVVGAGLSGLQAAHDVQKAGYSCVVVEARGRVGGKTWSREIANGKQDVGAAWINDTNQDRMWALAKRFNLRTVSQRTSGRIIFEDPVDGKFNAFPYGGVPQVGSRSPSSDRTSLNSSQEEGEIGGVAKMVLIRDLFESLCHKIDVSDPVTSSRSLSKDYDQMSLEEFVNSEGGGKIAQGTVNVWTKAMLGLDSREVSCLFFLDYCKSGGGIMQMRSDAKDGAQHLRLEEGKTTSLMMSCR